jgi:hypothetical protein
LAYAACVSPGTGPAALEQSDALDPTECRRYVEERFAPERMVVNYVEAYETAIERASG